MLQQVAVKIDLKEPKKRFLEMVAFLKSYGTTRIHLVHVAEKKSSKHLKEVRSKLEGTRQGAAELGFDVQVHIRHGHVPSAFIQVAEAEDVDFLCIYWTSKPLLRNALLGNVDSDILRLSCLPVFVYNPKILNPSTELHRVLYATDFKYTDAVVLPYLINSRFKADKLFLLHVGDRAPDPDTEMRRRENVLNNLNRLARECAHAYEEVEAIETLGLARKEIVKQAKWLDVDLIVAGKSQNPDFMSQVVGSTAEILPHKATCNVFIIPGVCSLPPSGDKEN